MEKKKVLVVYFSATGTTRQVAKQIAQIADADLYEIVPAKPYSGADLDWTNKQSRSSIEMNNPKARPEIKAPSVDVSKYDCVFLGYPIWWDLAPRVVNTFIERNNLTGKTVIPFATSGGSGLNEEKKFRELTGAEVEEGLCISNIRSSKARKQIQDWLSGVLE